MGRVSQYWAEERRVVAHLGDSIRFGRREVNFVRYFTMARRCAAGSICLGINSILFRSESQKPAQNLRKFLVAEPYRINQKSSFCAATCPQIKSDIFDSRQI